MTSSIEVRIKENDRSPADIFKFDDSSSLSNKFRRILFLMHEKYSALGEVLDTDIDTVITPIKINGEWYLKLEKRRYLK